MGIMHVEVDQRSADARGIVKVGDPVRWGNDAAEAGGDELAESLVLVGLEQIGKLWKKRQHVGHHEVFSCGDGGAGQLLSGLAVECQRFFAQHVFAGG